jgi:hypothetical protein
VALGGAFSRVLIDLYRADGARALARLEAVWPGIPGTRLGVVPLMRCAAFYHRGLAALGAASRAGAPAAALAVAEDAARELGTLPVALGAGLGALTAAGVADIRGDRSTAAQLYAHAAEELEADNAVNAACARARRAASLGGAEGRAAFERELTVLSGYGILDPQKWLRVVTPSVLAG